MENAFVTLITVFCVCAVSFGALYSIYVRSEEESCETEECSLVYAKMSR